MKQITKLLNLPHMQAKYIKFPQTPEERNEIKLKFFNKFNMPGVIGCIDCTHVAIIRPVENEERFYCRKQYHSLNVQLISNADMQIISVDASFGGASHDSFIWANHPLKEHMELISRNESIWLLGDSGYPLRRYMMTPVTDATPDTPEAYYTTSIVNACVILHNICNGANIPVQVLTNEEAMLEESSQTPTDTYQQSASTSTRNRELSEGLAVRNTLISHLWSSRSHAPAN
ncbi:hypothetical protein PYW08_004092 [Mythimna loreyi]|uniref:Uncharacterized protein n=1 Tax=Mythimna loreyi TaxID=667449 RepID=A0ACC2QV29_9NEOP|nr:hypothetical protein PYW08_004092 [Mythimna loreyi]